MNARCGGAKIAPSAWVWLLLCSLVCFSTSAWSQPPRDLIVHRCLHLDVDSNATVDTIGSRSFIDLADVQFTGNNHHAQWVRLELAPTDQPGWMLVLQPPMIHQATVYVPKAEGGWTTTELGLAKAVSSRPWPGMNYLVPLELPKNQPVTMYVRLMTPTGVIAVNVLQQRDALALDRTLETRVVVFLGMAAALAFVSLVTWYTAKDSLWLITAGLDLAMFVGQLVHSGLAARWLAPDAEQFWNRIQPYTAIIYFTIGATYYWRLLVIMQAKRSVTLLFAGSATIGIVLTAMLLAGAPAAWVFKLSMLQMLGLIPIMLFPSGIKSNDAVLTWAVKLSLFTLGVQMVVWLLPRLFDVSMLGWQALYPTIPSNLVTLTLSTFITVRYAILQNQFSRRHVKARLESEHRLAIEQARHEETTAFLAMVTHEIRNPLAIVRQVVANLLRSRSPDTHERGLLLIDKAVNDVTRILDRSSEVHRVETSLLQPDPHTVDAAQCLRSWCEQHAQAARLRLHVTHETLPATLDEELFLLMTRNLVENALKYSPAESLVTLHLDIAAPDFLCLRVLNEVGRYGPPDPYRVFQKYYRADHAQSVSGTGLGLYWVKMVSASLGGGVQLLRIVPEVEFELRLPRHAHVPPLPPLSRSVP